MLLSLRHYSGGRLPDPTGSLLLRSVSCRLLTGTLLRKGFFLLFNVKITPNSWAFILVGLWLNADTQNLACLYYFYIYLCVMLSFILVTGRYLFITHLVCGATLWTVFRLLIYLFKGGERKKFIFYKFVYALLWYCTFKTVNVSSGKRGRGWLCFAITLCQYNILKKWLLVPLMFIQTIITKHNVHFTATTAFDEAITCFPEKLFKMACTPYRHAEDLSHHREWCDCNPSFLCETVPFVNAARVLLRYK